MGITEELIKTEYSEKFDELRKNRMLTSYFKYGYMKDNYESGLVSAVKNLEDRLDKYKKTGNTELLVDVANFAMIEFMFPQHENQHFDSESHGTKLVGMTLKDLKEYKSE